MRRIVLMLCAVVCLGACKRTADSERSRYQATHDRIEALATKNPSMKADIQAKLAELDKAYKAAEAKQGDDQIAALAAVNDRMGGYEQAISPAPAAPKPDAAAAAKLGSKLGAAPDAGGGKLGAAPASQPAAGGGKLAPASQPASAPAAPFAKPSGFGGGPPDAGAKSGFGGK